MPPHNFVLLEHVNLHQNDMALATLFYVVGLGLTRDPYLMVGLDNMWINAGRTQFHLPSRAVAQRLRGCVGLVLPSLTAVRESLCQVAPALAHTQFSVQDEGSSLALTCPWGNRLRCHEPSPSRGGGMALGIAYVELDVPPRSVAGIARFYAELMGAQAALQAQADGRAAAVVGLQSQQQLRFVESAAPLAPYDGHHIQVYLADPTLPFERMQSRGLVTEQRHSADWRFCAIVDPATGAPLFELEHEVRGCDHPLYGRPLVNRNPAQSNTAYQRGADALEWDAQRPVS